MLDPAFPRTAPSGAVAAPTHPAFQVYLDQIDAAFAADGPIVASRLCREIAAFVATTLDRAADGDDDALALLDDEELSFADLEHLGAWLDQRRAELGRAIC